jgi:hypothetical protein
MTRFSTILGASSLFMRLNALPLPTPPPIRNPAKLAGLWRRMVLTASAMKCRISITGQCTHRGFSDGHEGRRSLKRDHRKLQVPDSRRYPTTHMAPSGRGADGTQIGAALKPGSLLSAWVAGAVSWRPRTRISNFDSVFR